MTPSQESAPETGRPADDATHKRIARESLPYLLMFPLGAAVMSLSVPPGIWPWLAPLLYVTYGVVGTFWLILFVCPYCAAYGSTLCPSGHGLLAAKLRPRKSSRDFPTQFKKNIPVIVPFWFVPFILGVVGLVTGFSWTRAVLLVVFSLDAFVLLPMGSRRRGCASCPQRGNCPWMRPASHSRKAQNA